MKQIPLVDATEDQLRKFAIEVLGLDIHHMAKSESITAKINQVWDKDTIAVEEENQTITAAPGTAPPNPNLDDKVSISEKPTAGILISSSKLDPKVHLELNRSDDKGGDRAVPLNVNGKTMLIPRGEACNVPYRYYLVLVNAVRTVYEQMDDGELAPREVPAYPFRVITMPDQAEIDAWEAAQAKLSAEAA